MASSSASPRLRRSQLAPHPEPVGRDTAPRAVPWLPPPAAFARKLHPAAATDAPAVERARAPVAAPWLPPPASFARRVHLHTAAAANVPAVERARGPVAGPWLPPPASFARRLHTAPRPAPPNPTAPEPPARAPMPPPPPPPSSSGRRRVRGAGEGQEARGWAALPRDALAAVLRRLDHVEILMGPGQVCRSWRRAPRDDPALWRRIDMRGHADIHRRVDLCGMAQAAIRRARGQCEAFWAEYAADDDVLQLLGEQ